MSPRLTVVYNSWRLCTTVNCTGVKSRIRREIVEWQAKKYDIIYFMVKMDRNFCPQTFSKSQTKGTGYRLTKGQKFPKGNKKGWNKSGVSVGIHIWNLGELDLKLRSRLRLLVYRNFCTIRNNNRVTDKEVDILFLLEFLSYFRESSHSSYHFRVFHNRKKIQILM